MGPGCAPDASLAAVLAPASISDKGGQYAGHRLLRPRREAGCTWEPHLYRSPLCPGTLGDVYYTLSISRLRQSFLQT